MSIPQNIDIIKKQWHQNRHVISITDVFCLNCLIIWGDLHHVYAFEFINTYLLFTLLPGL